MDACLSWARLLLWCKAGMGRQPRRHEPNTCHLITSRCLEAKFFFRPDRKLNEAVLEWLARAESAHPGIQIFGLVVMSNHIHLLVRDTQAELAAWAGYLFGNIAKAVNGIRGRENTFFGRRYSDEPVLDGPALFDRLVYVATNPVKAGLCEQSQQWPGLLLWARGDETELHEVSRVDREAYRKASERAKKRGEKPPSRDAFLVRETLSIHPLPTESSAMGSDGRSEIAAAIEARELEIAADRRRSGKSTMGHRRVLAQDWHAAPRRPKRTPRPLCHTTERGLFEAFVEGFREFVAAFRDASEQWRAGMRGVTFPPWSYPPSCPLVRPAEPALG